jgi:hypothetical protein
VAEELAMDLIVMGVKRTPVYSEASLHLPLATAYKVVSQAICPVLTARRWGVGMNDAILVRDWNVDDFHRYVLDLETHGYLALRETSRITAEANPETGEVIHLYVIEMFLS